MATHKMAKGDKLELVAKKHGHADWKTVWNAPENKALAGKRGKPELLQPGDVLHIPMTAKDRAGVLGKIGQHHMQRGVEIGLRDALKSEINRIPKVVAMYDGMMAGQATYTKETIAELRANVESMKRVAEGVDFAAEVLRMGVNIEQLRRAYKKSLELSGEALKKANKEMADEIAGGAKEAVEDAAVSAIATLRDDAKTALAAVGILADSWERIGTPSFWAHSLTVMVSEGKSWSEAATSDVGDSIRERIDAVTAGATNQIQLWRKLRDARRERLATYQSLLKLCEARIKDHERAAASLQAQLGR